MQNEYRCPTCNQSAKKPPWLIAREKGFNDEIHCGMMANRFGKLVICKHKPQLSEKNGFTCATTGDICENCKIFQALTETITDKYGREKTVMKGEK